MIGAEEPKRAKLTTLAIWDRKWPLLKLSARELRDLFFFASCKWGEDNAPRISAALSFYAALSMAPFLVIAVMAGGVFFGEASARAEILNQAKSAFGQGGADFLNTLIDNTRKPTPTIIATVISVIVMFGSAANLFLNLKDATNSIWSIKGYPNPWLNAFVARVKAWILVVVFGSLVLAWLFLDAWIGWVERKSGLLASWQYLSFGISFIFLLLVFAFTYRVLPRSRVVWRDVWFGAIVAAFGVSVTKYLLGLYFTFSGISALYGSAGALVVILLWINYTNWVYWFGMELVWVYAHRHGSQKGKVSNWFTEGTLD
ncbi:MAG: YihY/virulence factor BrkB family protein [Fimbriimonas sp.]